MKRIVGKLLRTAGYEIRKSSDNLARSDYGEFERRIFGRVRPYTMTSPERVIAVIDAARYISAANVPGVVVECGVWRGGCVMAAALTLLALGDIRELCLFDTFAGMPQPSPNDGTDAMVKFRRLRQGDGSRWCDASVDEVASAIASTGYPMDRVHLIKGKVEDTLPRAAPEDIALLRLDTDWYESTKHELTHLYPRLAPRGVLIIDDYGDWQGSRKAVDEYMAAAGISLLLNRSDKTGRIAVKA